MKFYDLSREIIIKHVALLPIREKVMHTSFHSNIIHAIRKKDHSLDDRLPWHKLHTIEKYVLGFIDRSAYHKGSCRVVLPPSDQNVLLWRSELHLRKCWREQQSLPHGVGAGTCHLHVLEIMEGQVSIDGQFGGERHEVNQLKLLSHVKSWPTTPAFAVCWHINFLLVDSVVYPPFLEIPGRGTYHAVAAM